MNNEIQRLHFEIKRLNKRIDSLQLQLQNAVAKAATAQPLPEKANAQAADAPTPA